MNVLLLVLKLFVSSHPLNFKGDFLCLDCVTACHLKNYFVYHLPTRGRAGVKLGDADTLQTYL